MDQDDTPAPEERPLADGPLDETLALPDRDTARNEQTTVPVGGRQLPRIDGYEILGVLGEGGMGLVLHARQTDLGREVAVKVIRSGSLASDSEVQRFQREARLVAGLHHPNIVAVYDFGEVDGHHYLTMEYVDGRPLTMAIREGEVTARDAVELIRTLADALHYAHTQGVVHRDVKPGNLMLDRGGNLRLLDFGLSFERESDGALTATGLVLGTPSYMPPEQARGERADARSDIYSAGAVLYELLAGQPPFVGDSPVAIMQQVLKQSPPLLRSLRPAVPRDLEVIAGKALAYDAADRFPSAIEMRDELERVLRDEPIRSRPLAAHQRVAKWARRNPLVAALLGLVLLTLVAGSSTTAIYALRARATAQLERDARHDAEHDRKRADEARKAAERSEQRAVENAHRAESQTLRARRSQYASELLLARSDMDLGRLHQARQLLLKQWPFPGETDLRGPEWFLLWEILHTTQTRFAAPGHLLRRVVFTPDGQRIAATGTSGDVIVYEAATGRPVLGLRAPGGEAQRHLCISPDGKTLISGIGKCFAWSLEDGTLMRTFGSSRDVGELSVAQCSDYHPNRGWVVTGHGDGTAGGDSELKLWDVETGELIRRFGDRSTRKNWVYRVQFSPDGKLVASGGADRVVKVWDVETGQLAHTLDGHRSNVEGLEFANDTTLISGSWDGTVHIWNLDSGQSEATLQGGGDIIRDVCISPNGKRLLVVESNVGRVTLWDLPERKRVQVIEDRQAVLYRAAFAPDGQTVATVGGAHSKERKIKLWHTDTWEPVEHEFHWPDAHSRRVRRRGCLIAGQSSSPDRGELWTIYTDGALQCRDAQGLEVLREKAYTFSEPQALAHHPTMPMVAIAFDDGTVKLLDAADLSEIATTRVPESRIHRSSRLVFHDKEPRLLIGAFNRLMDWDYARGELKQDAGLGGGIDAAFSPDGRSVATADNTRVSLWSWPEGKLQRQSKHIHTGRIQRIGFSPDRERLATGDGNGLVVLWDARRLTPIYLLRGHTGSIHDFAFQRGGERLVTVSGDNTCRFWSTELGIELARLDGFGHEVHHVHFNRDETVMLNGVRLFFGPTNRWAEIKSWQLGDQSAAARRLLEPPPLFIQRTAEEQLALTLQKWIDAEQLSGEERVAALQSAWQSLQEAAGAQLGPRVVAVQQALANELQVAGVAVEHPLGSQQELASPPSTSEPPVEAVVDAARQSPPPPPAPDLARHLLDQRYQQQDDRDFGEEDGTRMGIADGTRYWKFPENRRLNGPMFDMKVGEVGDFQLRLRTRQTDLVSWTFLPEVGDAATRRRLAVLLHPSGIDEVRLYHYRRKGDQWQETGYDVLGQCHLPSVGEGPWLEVRIVRRGAQYQFIQDERVIFEFRDEHPEHVEAVEDAALRCWLLPATNRPAQAEWRLLDLAEVK